MSLFGKIKQAFETEINTPDIKVDTQAFYPQFRLEGRARDADNDDNLAMRTADPLWMLGRQWQFGEFVGEDNGSPIQVVANYYKYKASHYSKIKKPNEADPFETKLDGIPLETKIEAMKIEVKDLRTKVKIGQQFKRILCRHLSPNASEVIKILQDKHPLARESKKDFSALSFTTLMQNKAIDGAVLLGLINKNELIEIIEIKDLINDNKIKEENLINAGLELSGWYKALYFQPDNPEETLWDEKQLLHKFKLTASSEKSNAAKIFLNAPDYQSGQLDWYSFDSAAYRNFKEYENTSPANLPVNVSFGGMPDKRLFSFEDRRIDLGSMDIQDTDLIRIMMLDFSLYSGSDWFAIPMTMELGELCWVNHIEVKDVFGVTTKIENNDHTGSTLSKHEENGRLTGLDVWDVFKIRDENRSKYIPKEHFLFLPPVVAHKQESKALEEVIFMRDEFANMVWAIEKQVKNELGKTVDGFDLHLEVNGPFIPSDEGENNDGNTKFRFASNVPSNWIPYLPLQKDATTMILERARMVSNASDKEFMEFNPLTHLTKNDLKTIYEEAIPRAGVRVQLTRQRIRWTDGRTYIWQGRKVLTGRGGGNSGLKFDYLKNPTK